MPDEGSGAALP